MCVCVKGVKGSDWLHGITDPSPSSSHTPFYLVLYLSSLLCLCSSSHSSLPSLLLPPSFHQPSSLKDSRKSIRPATQTTSAEGTYTHTQHWKCHCRYPNFTSNKKTGGEPQNWYFSQFKGSFKESHFHYSSDIKLFRVLWKYTVTFISKSKICINYLFLHIRTIQCLEIWSFITVQ